MVSAPLTDQQIANVAKASGWTSTSEIAIAVAVALAESGGRPEATHVNSNGSTDYGLWQVNSIHGFDPNRLLTPTGNGSAAHQVYSEAGNKWTPWSTYKSGAYLAFLARGRAVAGSASAGGSVNDPPIDRPIPGVSSLSDLYSSITSLANWVSNANNWRRVGLFILGAILLTYGLFKVTGNNQLSPTTKAVAKAATTVAVKAAK